MAVFGIDNRQIVTTTTSPPWSSIVRLVTTFPGTTTKFLSTGFVIDENTVLAAAHTLYHQADGGLATSITIEPARSGSTLPYGSTTAISIQIAPAYQALEDDLDYAAWSHDFAVITTADPILAPALNIGWTGQGAILGQTVTSAGYPIAKGGDVLVSTSGTVDETDDRALIFRDDLDNSGGQSGSPILYGGQAIGLASHETGTANVALRFDAELVAQVELWRTTNDATPGNDLILGGPWGERWDAGAGNDTVSAMDGNDTVFGGTGNDDVNGNKGTDLVYGGPGSDFARGGQANDLVYGEDGDDWHVNGNLGEDVIFGGNGNDQVFGGGGNDLLYGEDGDDTLSGDLGNDMLVGGFGRDVFLFLEGAGDDRILDFNPAHDLILGPQAISITAADGGSLVQLAGGGTILLHGVAPSVLDAEHFLVV